ncbi:MAG: hypothetical protein GC181_15735 [Bacteroidetes bacterium]|nr:hypothetical protein [Bacteroidota bacterium]
MKNDFNIESFDELFKQTFESAQTPVPPGVWEGISTATTGAATTATTSTWLTKLLGWKGVAIISTVATITTLTITNLTAPNKPDSSTTGSAPENQISETQNDVSNPVISSNDELKKSEDQTSAGENVTVKNENSTSPQNTSHKPANNGTLAPTSSDHLPPTYPGSHGEHTPNLLTPTKTNENPEVEINLVINKHQICVPGTISAGLQTDEHITVIEWKLNGKVLTSKSDQLEIAITNTGLNTLYVKVKDSKGRIYERNKTIDGRRVSAKFSVDQSEIDLGFVSIKANESTPLNSWFVNSVKYGSGSEIRVDVSEMSSLQVMHIARDAAGCSDTVVQPVNIRSCTIDPNTVPNILTPELADGKNDVFEINVPSEEDYYLVVYSRDNKVVFESNSPKILWNGSMLNDGEALPYGPYYYKLRYKCNGTMKFVQGVVNIQ